MTVGEVEWPASCCLRLNRGLPVERRTDVSGEAL
jgi:hypothetical protein